MVCLGECGRCKLCFTPTQKDLEQKMTVNNVSQLELANAVTTIGTILDTDNVGRDAIHVACISAISSMKLFPGQDVSYENGVAQTSGKLVGIVDPFLKLPVQPGQRFWILLYPRTITSLRHVWTHPDFEDEDIKISDKKDDTSKDAAIIRIKDFFKAIDEEYFGNKLVKMIDGDVITGDYAFDQDNDYGFSFDWVDGTMTIYGTSIYAEIPKTFLYDMWIATGVDAFKTAYDRYDQYAETPYFRCSC